MQPRELGALRLNTRHRELLAETIRAIASLLASFLWRGWFSDFNEDRDLSAICERCVAGEFRSTVANVVRVHFFLRLIRNEEEHRQVIECFPNGP